MWNWMARLISRQRLQDQFHMRLNSLIRISHTKWLLELFFFVFNFYSFTSLKKKKEMDSVWNSLVLKIPSIILLITRYWKSNLSVDSENYKLREWSTNLTIIFNSLLLHGLIGKVLKYYIGIDPSWVKNVVLLLFIFCNNFRK